jgi:hypothetical protein
MAVAAERSLDERLLDTDDRRYPSATVAAFWKPVAGYVDAFLPEGFPSPALSPYPMHYVEAMTNRLTDANSGAATPRLCWRAVSGDNAGRDLTVKTAAAALTGLAGLLAPDAEMAATALQPAAEAVLGIAADQIDQRRMRNRAEMLADASEAAHESPENVLLQAVSDDARHELLIRALSIAQDTALRD